MHRILFSIANHNVSAYSFFAVLALLIVSGGIYLFGQRRGFSHQQLTIAISAMAVSAFVGARLLHIITNQELYTEEIWRVFRLDFTGFSIYGGILAAMFAGIISASFLKINIWRLGDATAPFLGLGIISMRIGCFLNGCCFGHATELPWGVRFPFMSQVHSHQLSLDPAHLFYVSPVHPTQLYELAYALLGALLAYIIIKKKMNDGLAILVFGLVYTIGRLINLQFRVMPPTLDSPVWFYPVLYGAMIILIALLIIKKRNGYIGLCRCRKGSE